MEDQGLLILLLLLLLLGTFYFFHVWYRSPTKIPNRDKKTESPYLVHPLTYRQVYLTKDAYFVEKIHCELVEMAVGQRMNKIRFSCHNIYWFGFLVTIRNFRRAPVNYRKHGQWPCQWKGMTHLFEYIYV